MDCEPNNLLGFIEGDRRLCAMCKAKLYPCDTVNKQEFILGYGEFSISHDPGYSMGKGWFVPNLCTACVDKLRVWLESQGVLLSTFDW